MRRYSRWVPAVRWRNNFFAKQGGPPVAGLNPNLDYDYIWCYATLQVMKLTYPTFASPLLYLLCQASEALATTNMSAGCLSTRSLACNNQICAKSPPVPSHVGLITPPLAHAPQPIAHRNPLSLVWCHCCKSRRVILRVSTTIRNPGRVFYKCPNHGVIICLCCSSAFSCCFFNSLVDDLPI